MDLELHQLQRKYAGLRVVSGAGLGRLVASLSEVGQQSPVLVVLAADGSPVLIDGYRRVAALERLHRDTVVALQLGVDEAEALLLRHRMASDERRSALEDGWLLRELHDTHQVSQRELGVRLGKSPSWVSRRLGLVRELPESVQQLVRRGELPAQGAMKYLLPLSRANAAACERLTASLAGSRWSVRELGQIYVTWRKSSPEVRLRIEAQPREFCRALKALEPDVQDGDRDLCTGLQRLGGLCRRLQHLVGVRLASGETRGDDKSLELHWNTADRDMTALRASMASVVHP